MLSEVTVILKSEDATYRENFPCYDSFSIQENDIVLRSMIDEAKKKFKLTPDQISIKIHVEWLEG